MDTKYKTRQDDWPTTEREAYADTPHFREVRPAKRSRNSSGFLDSVGTILMFGGIGWGAYVFVTGGPMTTISQLQNAIAICAGGVLLSFVSKFFGK